MERSRAGQKTERENTYTKGTVMTGESIRMQVNKEQMHQ